MPARWHSQFPESASEVQNFFLGRSLLRFGCGGKSAVVKFVSPLVAAQGVRCSLRSLIILPFDPILASTWGLNSMAYELL
jgi:hypothetical protein